MKISRQIRHKLLVGIISLTLVSCGGGGGSDSADSAINQLADIIENNTETQSNTLAPDSLSPGMKFYITGASRPDAVLSITSANTCTDSIAGECTYSYRKITDSTAKLDLQWGDYKESYSFAFKDMESGNAIWIWSMNGQEMTEDVKFRLEGRSNSSNTQTQAPGSFAVETDGAVAGLLQYTDAGSRLICQQQFNRLNTESIHSNRFCSRFIEFREATQDSQLFDCPPELFNQLCYHCG